MMRREESQGGAELLPNPQAAGARVPGGRPVRIGGYRIGSIEIASASS